MTPLIRTSLAAAALALTAHASAQVTLYEREDFSGRTFLADRAEGDLQRNGFSDRASSAVVSGGTWEVCDDSRYGGRCVVLRPGRYNNLQAVGLNDRISSLRPADPMANGGRRGPPPPEAITFYDQEGFNGRSFSTERPVANFERDGFNDRASSVVVAAGSWEVCSDARFGGRCAVLRAGEYPSLVSIGLNDRISSVRRLENSAPVPPVAVAPSATFFEQENFRGLSFTTDQQVGNFDRQGFNGRAGSVHIVGGRWEACEDPRFGGRCMFLQPGSYPTLQSMGLGDRIASVRNVTTEGQAIGSAVDPRPLPPPYDARRRGGERLYQADVIAVREVVGTADQRCWVERQPVPDSRGGPNVPGALAGAVIGGILGHQVGGGSGRDAATAVGVIGGAVAGANVNRGQATQDVQRCSTANSQATPNYWDVTYNFRGLEHRVQMASPPQATVTVNEQGEPRI